MFRYIFLKIEALVRYVKKETKVEIYFELKRGLHIFSEEEKRINLKLQIR